MGTGIRTIKMNNRHGFTMVEIICVIIIIGIVSSITLPAIDNFRSGDRCKAEASVLVSYIRQAKYQAMQDNSLIRVIFDVDSGVFSTFKVQMFEPSSGNKLTGKDIDEIVEKYSNSLYSKDGDGAGEWVSIADSEEVEFSSSTEVAFKDWNNKNTIFFKPDGYLYASRNDMISEQRIIVKYGSSAVAVDVNALGVIGSEAMATDEGDDYFDDDYNASETDDSKYTATGTE